MHYLVIPEDEIALNPITDEPIKNEAGEPVKKKFIHLVRALVLGDTEDENAVTVAYEVRQSLDGLKPGDVWAIENEWHKRLCKCIEKPPKGGYSADIIQSVPWLKLVKAASRVEAEPMTLEKVLKDLGDRRATARHNAQIDEKKGGKKALRAANEEK